MNRRTLVPVLIVGLFVTVIAPPVFSAGIRSVGLRLILPATGIPLVVGAEVVTDVSLGELSISLFLSPAGGSLLLGSVDVALTGDPSAARAFLRLTTGLAYFDASRRFPSFLVGAGTSARLSVAESFLFGLTGELIYPIAFPIPLITVAGAWALP